MSNKFIKLENLAYYDGKIKEYINNNIGTGNGIEIYDDYSQLPTDLTEKTIAYCEEDYIETITNDDGTASEVIYNKGFYIYDLLTTKWKTIYDFDLILDGYIKKEKLVAGENIDIEMDAENNIIINSSIESKSGECELESREW